MTSGHTPEPTQLVEVLLLVPACFTCVTADCSLESTEGGMAIAPPIRWEKLFLGWSHQIDAVGLRRLRNPGQESDSPIVLNKCCVDYAKSKQSVLFLNKKCKALNTLDLWFDVPCTTIVYSLMLWWVESFWSSLVLSKWGSANAAHFATTTWHAAL